MKIAVIYNRESKAVINLFGVPNREKYGLQTINMIKSALKSRGHQVRAFEGDKNIIHKLEDFMPSVISGERPGLVLNLSYGIQGRARYTHIPSILEMLGIPYVGSSPLTQAIALDKVVTKMILMEKGLPTPKFALLDRPDDPLIENLNYPLIVKPKDEAVSFGIKIVNNEDELREGARVIHDMFKTPTLVEEYIEGREVNVALLGNDPVRALPPVELIFPEGEKIYTYEDKTHTSGRSVGKICPAPLTPEETEHVQSLAISAFNALGCFDSARVDFRIDQNGDPYILEINSLASLGPGGSFVYAASNIGLDYDDVVNELVEITSKRYFGDTEITNHDQVMNENHKNIFNFLTESRDKIEETLKYWTNMPSRTNDPVALSSVVRKLDNKFRKYHLVPAENFTNMHSAWTWETKAGLEGGTLLVVPIDVPETKEGYPIPFRRDPEWLYGEGIASSRAGLACIIQTIEALAKIDKLASTKLGIFVYSDEGRGMRYSGQVLRRLGNAAQQVLVMQPGYRGGKVVNQRRGSRKFSVLVESGSFRIGYRSTKTDALTWFLQKIERVGNLSQIEKHLTVAVQDVHSDRYGMLLPHRVRATVYVTYLNSQQADEAENQLKKFFNTNKKGIQSYIEKIEERPPLSVSKDNEELISVLKKLSEEWKLPFGTESSLIPSAAGEISLKTPVVCGVGPTARNLHTPNEAVHRGELLQKALLLTLFLLDKKND